MTSPKALEPLALGACYHCEKKTRTNSFCEMWRVWTCTGCHETHHRKHHMTCERVLPAGAAPTSTTPKYFTVWVTRYDGRRMPLLCRLGEKLEMEDHWMGTYIFAAAGVVLVLEIREAINALILAGLQTTS